MNDSEFKILGMSLNQIIKIRKFWLKHNIELPTDDLEHNQERDLNDNLPRIKQVIDYCYSNLDQMWAASVCSILLGCDFRDAKIFCDKFYENYQQETYKCSQK